MKNHKFSTKKFCDIIEMHYLCNCNEKTNNWFIMKKLYLFLFAVSLCMGMVSCDKEDETVRLEVYGEVPYQPIDMKDMPEWLTALMAEQYMGGLYCICVGTYNGEKVYNLLLVSDSHFTGRFYNENGESVNIVDLNQYSVVKCIYYRRDFSL